MITRTLIRQKVVQILYAYLLRENTNVEAAEKELTFSLNKAYELYLYLLLLMVAVKHYAEDRMALRRQRLQPTAEDINPNRRFVDNRFINQLEQNSELAERKKSLKLSWKDAEDVVRRLFENIERGDAYCEYMNAPDEPSYDDDRALWRKLYKQYIMDSDELDDLFEEQSLYWNDDKAVVDTFVLKTIRQFDPAMGAEQVLSPQFRDMEDAEFAQTLLRRALTNAATYRELIDEQSSNWTGERIAFMDTVIMVTALAEVTSFPSIPLGVTLNEYVEIAKFYSTPSSGSFINGILDAAAKKLKKNEK
ncbi:MAG: transcription antitermination protein NusB [Bacteroidaceae bacterium]|nr:transcription antitermination protein NusB [Bacteroidaceae bacterium]